MKTFYTYLHCRPDGEPFYVGKGHGKRSHDFYHRGLHHKNIIAKYGLDNILVYVFHCESEEDAFLNEIHQIAQLKSEGYKLFNQTNGGDGASGAVRSIATRLKMSKPKSMEHRAKFFGNKNGHGCKGTKQKTEHIAKRIAIHIGAKRSIETRLKQSAWQKGKPKGPMSEEHKAKISAANKGQISWSKGLKLKPVSEETKKKLSEAGKRYWSNHKGK